MSNAIHTLRGPRGNDKPKYRWGSSVGSGHNLYSRGVRLVVTEQNRLLVKDGDRYRLWSDHGGDEQIALTAAQEYARQEGLRPIELTTDRFLAESNIPPEVMQAKEVHVVSKRVAYATFEYAVIEDRGRNQLNQMRVIHLGEGQIGLCFACGDKAILSLPNLRELLDAVEALDATTFEESFSA